MDYRYSIDNNDFCEILLNFYFRRDLFNRSFKSRIFHKCIRIWPKSSNFSLTFLYYQRCYFLKYSFGFYWDITRYLRIVLELWTRNKMSVDSQYVKLVSGSLVSQDPLVRSAIKRPFLFSFHSVTHGIKTSSQVSQPNSGYVEDWWI